ncbi:uncharacterized protein [Triticum aestivum]|uniref:uncharacterized protein isoform X2 n=1 Tax=Triticum aestivum TaxID=4565 RepID=UPI001D004292|nr:uncharacterized protein LOC123097604 isoform X2 [Triticum aestivum]
MDAGAPLSSSAALHPCSPARPPPPPQLTPQPLPPASRSSPDPLACLPNLPSFTPKIISSPPAVSPARVRRRHVPLVDPASGRRLGRAPISSRSICGEPDLGLNEKVSFLSLHEHAEAAALTDAVEQAAGPQMTDAVVRPRASYSCEAGMHGDGVDAPSVVTTPGGGGGNTAARARLPQPQHPDPEANVDVAQYCEADAGQRSQTARRSSSIRRRGGAEASDGEDSIGGVGVAQEQQHQRLEGIAAAAEGSGGQRLAQIPHRRPRARGSGQRMRARAAPARDASRATKEVPSAVEEAGVQLVAAEEQSPPCGRRRSSPSCRRHRWAGAPRIGSGGAGGRWRSGDAGGRQRAGLYGGCRRRAGLVPAVGVRRRKKQRGN